MSIQQNRKDHHVDLAEKFYATSQPNDFDALRFVHHSFPEINSADVSLQTSFAGLSFSSPFYINGMTGGSPKTAIINHDLATVARETNLAMASGSISAGIKHPETQESFRIIRKTNPNGLIFANLGAEHSLENAKIAVDLLEANALQLHVNAPQELVMPEGERNFNGWLQNIEKIVANLEVPVIVKEVGFGMSQETIQQLIDVGVRTIDISGRGGTNFAQIENARREQNDLNFTSDWGQSTAVSLLESYALQNQVEILASGGIKTPMDMIKALSLGAKATGLSGQFLHLIVTQGVEKTIQEVTYWQENLQMLMTLLGKKSLSELTTTDLVLTEPLVSWCLARDIQWKHFAQRS